MQRGGHGCSVEGTWVGRTREPAGPADGKQKKSLHDLMFLLVLCFVRLGTALSNVRTHARTYVRTYVRTYIRTYVRKYVRTYVRTCVRTLDNAVPSH